MFDDHTYVCVCILYIHGIAYRSHPPHAPSTLPSPITVYIHAHIYIHIYMYIMHPPPTPTATIYMYIMHPHPTPTSVTHYYIHTHIHPPTSHPHSCLYLINAFSLLIDASEALTDIGGLAARLDELLLALTPEEEEETDGPAEAAAAAAAPYYTPPVVPSSGGSKGPVPLLTIEGLSLRLPDGRWLLRDFGLTVRVCVMTKRYIHIHNPSTHPIQTKKHDTYIYIHLHNRSTRERPSSSARPVAGASPR